MTSQYRALIESVAGEFALDARMLEAQVWQESSDDPFALRVEERFFEKYVVGNVHAAARRFGVFAGVSVGLLQVMVETACERGFAGMPWDLADPRTGLYWGARHLAWLRDRHQGDLVASLLAYNGGADATYPQRVLQRESELT